MPRGTRTGSEALSCARHRGTRAKAPRGPGGVSGPGPSPRGNRPRGNAADLQNGARAGGAAGGRGRGREGARAATAGSVRHCRVGNGDALPQGCEPAGGLSRASCCAAVKRTLRLAMRGSRRSPARPVLWEHTRAHTRIRVHTPHTRSLRKGQDINTSRAPTMGQEKRPCFPATPVRPWV